MDAKAKGYDSSKELHGLRIAAGVAALTASVHRKRINARLAAVTAKEYKPLRGGNTREQDRDSPMVPELWPPCELGRRVLRLLCHGAAGHEALAWGHGRG